MKMMSDTIATIAKALVATQKEMGVATKDAANPFFKSKFADLNAIREAVLPALNKNGISALQPTVVIEGKKYVQTTLLHESGEWLASYTEILAAKETDPQAQGSGISYARRYGLQSLLNVGAEDDDGEGAMGRKPSYNSKPAQAPAKEAATSTPAEKKEEPAKPASKFKPKNAPATPAPAATGASDSALDDTGWS